jgi:hypothetical protein
VSRYFPPEFPFLDFVHLIFSIFGYHPKDHIWMRRRTDERLPNLPILLGQCAILALGFGSLATKKNYNKKQTKPKLTNNK